MSNDDNSLPRDMLLMIKSLKERRREILFQFLDFVRKRLKLHEITEKNITEIKLNRLISKIDYNDIIEFKQNIGHRPTYNVLNIIEDISGIRIEKPENCYSKELKKELNDYKKFVTNKLNIDIPKIMIQREATFDSITIRGINTFISFLVTEKNARIGEITTLFDYTLDYFFDYIYYLRAKCPTSSITFKIRFIRSIFYFYRNHRIISDKDNERIDKLMSDYRKLIDRMLYEESARTKNKRNRRKVELQNIIDVIKRLDDEYKVKKNYYILKSKVVLMILVHLGWRASNIVNLKIGETMFFENGKWCYRFRPDQQKAPLVVSGSYVSIEGEFPKRLQHDITELFNKSKSKDYLLLTQGKRKYSTTSFSSYVKKITSRYLDTELNPHIFRDIVFSHLIKNGYNFVNAELFLWHKPKSITLVDLNYLDIDVNSAVKYVNKKLEKLYITKKKEEKDNEATVSSNILRFPKSS